MEEYFRGENMIFVTVGTQKFQMNRLLEKLDDLIRDGKITERVFAQIGYSDYKPQRCDYMPFLDESIFNKKISECSLIITHAGVGNIISGLLKNKKIIVFPRLAEYHEHVDDHQVEIANKFSDENYVIKCTNADELVVAIKKSKSFEPRPFISDNKKFVDNIRNFIERR